MMNLLLRARHWQLFLFTFGIPFFSQIIFAIFMIISTVNTGEPNISFMVGYLIVFTIMMVLFSVVLYGWFYAIAVGLQEKIPEQLKLNVKRFKIFFFTPLIYLFFFLIFMAFTFSDAFINNTPPNPSFLIIVFPLHLFAMFCMFYMLYFVAKTFKTAELQRKVKFSDYAGEFFLLWFYPIGIWIIQPKINKIVEEQ